MSAIKVNQDTECHNKNHNNGYPVATLRKRLEILARFESASAVGC